VRRELGEAAELLCCSELAREGAAAADHQAIRAQGDGGPAATASEKLEVLAQVTQFGTVFWVFGPSIARKS